LKFLFAWRYFKSKKRTNAVNIISWISITAIGVGAAALILVLSVFNGFEDLVKGLYGDFYADAKITASQGKVVNLTREQITALQKTKGIHSVSLIAEEKALLKNGDNQTTVFVKGVDEHFTEVTNIDKHIIRGLFNTGDTENPQIVIGAGIESATAIYIEKSTEKATLYLPNKKSTNFSNLNNAFNSYNVLATGTFMIQQEFDNKYIFTNIGFMKFMLDLQPDEYTAAELKLSATSEKETKTIVETISKMLGSNYTIQTRYQQNQSLYTVMKMEKWFIYAILSLILIVAAFNMIGALTMLVLEKQKDIAVLKAIGANNTSIQNIFLSVGLLLATVGGASGILIATIICCSQQKFKILELGTGSFVVDYYPVKMYWLDFVIVISTIFIVAIAASFLPARKASRAIFSLKS
jgi:lipoprotein-releasing system permease protein